MYNGLLHAHSGLRWIALGLILFAIINAVRSQSSGEYAKKDKMLNLFAMVFLHIQLLIGFVLFFINERGRVNYSDELMSNPLFRFFGMEHILGMVIAIAVITIGRSKAEKKMRGSRNKHRKIMVSYTIGLILILASIPWPFRTLLLGEWI